MLDNQRCNKRKSSDFNAVDGKRRRSWGRETDENVIPTADEKNISDLPYAVDNTTPSRLSPVLYDHTIFPQSCPAAVEDESTPISANVTTRRRPDANIKQLKNSPTANGVLPRVQTPIRGFVQTLIIIYR